MTTNSATLDLTIYEKERTKEINELLKLPKKALAELVYEFEGVIKEMIPSRAQAGR